MRAADGGICCSFASVCVILILFLFKIAEYIQFCFAGFTAEKSHEDQEKIGIEVKGFHSTAPFAMVEEKMIRYKKSIEKKSRN